MFAALLIASLFVLATAEAEDASCADKVLKCEKSEWAAFHTDADKTKCTNWKELMPAYRQCMEEKYQPDHFTDALTSDDSESFSGVGQPGHFEYLKAVSVCAHTKGCFCSSTYKEAKLACQSNWDACTAAAE